MWGRVTALLSYQVLKEDLQIFRHVQRGEQAAADTSIFGRCEERLYAFQKFLMEQIHRAENLRTSGSTACSESIPGQVIDKPNSEQK